MTHAPLRIGQLASLAGATPDTLRYYERLGLYPPGPACVCRITESSAIKIREVR